MTAPPTSATSTSGASAAIPRGRPRLPVCRRRRKPRDGRDYAAAAAAGAAAILTDERPLDALQAVAADGVPVLMTASPRRSWRWPRPASGPPAGHDRRRHRHQRQDLDRRFPAPDLAPCDLGGGLDRHAGLQGPDPQRMQGRIIGLPSLTTPDAPSLHAALQPLVGRRDASCARGQQPRAGTAPSRRAEDACRRLHEPQPRPSRPPRRHGSLFRRQGWPPLLMPGGSAVINIDDPFGARLAATLRAIDPSRHVVLTIGETTPRTSGLPRSCRPISDSMSPSAMAMRITASRWRLPAVSRQ